MERPVADTGPTAATGGCRATSAPTRMCAHVARVCDSSGADRGTPTHRGVRGASPSIRHRLAWMHPDSTGLVPHTERSCVGGHAARVKELV